MKSIEIILYDKLNGFDKNLCNDLINGYVLSIKGELSSELHNEFYFETKQLLFFETLSLLNLPGK
jgi:hypothetical protein